MSANSTRVTDEHFRYIAARTLQEDAFLRDLKQAAERAGIPPIWIAPETGAARSYLHQRPVTTAAWEAAERRSLSEL